MTQKSGLKGTLSLLKKTYKTSARPSSSSPTPGGPAEEEEDEVVAESKDGSALIRLSPAPQGEDVLSVELQPGGGRRGGREEPRQQQEEEEEEKKKGEPKE
ncbi:hypothetical protein ANANG_G00109870 [Anguilla anguilla]|uniref:Uncharacterized protein n=1 Tax=Anguilla anguilla TaxID=7936 RepID=A0A9D3RZX0_ANGAN|nr:hypothetical protein ANANG_G00109870 [Anguilla anguilla]